ncbi:MAG: hypothetical protein ACRDNF_20655 [Streptosporangiaceae bacterium]
MPLTVLASAPASQSIASQVAPGALGFLVVASMALALFFLIRSMNKQLHKVGADKRSFGPPEESAGTDIPVTPRRDS